ncbi:MAG: hypothetical protein Q7W30_07840 [Coriobacteriia bacterium]|nr:hypothetical protein [Coriobacteriia bacterium]
MRTGTASVALAVALVVAASGLGGCQQPLSPEATSDGLKLVEARCTRCHTIDRVKGKVGAKRFQWQAIISRMQEKGADLTPQEQVTILDFLSSGTPF